MNWVRLSPFFAALVSWICAPSCGQDYGSSDFLIVADRNNSSIYMGSLSDFRLFPLPIANTTAPVALGFDPVDRMLYWTDYMDTSILRSRLDGSQRQVLVHERLVDPGGLALDPDARLMFWTDGWPNKLVERASMDGLHRRVLIKEKNMPRAIAVDPRLRHVYWSTLGMNAAITRCNYEGKDRHVVVTSDLRWPNGIALDLTGGGWLYWCDAKTKVFEKSDLLGGHRQVLLRENQSHPYGLALHGDTLLWTDWNADWLLRLHMANETVEAAGNQTFAVATGILVHTADQRGDLSTSTPSTTCSSPSVHLDDELPLGAHSVSAASSTGTARSGTQTFVAVLLCSLWSGTVLTNH